MDCSSHSTTSYSFSAGGLQPSGKTKLFDNLEWRNIGPVNMGGRVTDIEGIPGNPFTVYASTASGGLWKTINMGVTWTPLFEGR